MAINFLNPRAHLAHMRPTISMLGLAHHYIMSHNQAQHEASGLRSMGLWA